LQVFAGLRWTQDQQVAHLEDIRQRCTDPDTGWFGIKMHYHHYIRWSSALEVLRPLWWIRVCRQDRVAQAVSWARALETGQWTSHKQPTLLPPIYSRWLIQRQLDAIDWGERGWDTFFSQSGIQPLELEHKRIVSDLAGTVHEVYEFLGILPQSIIHADLMRQSDGMNLAWIRRFQASSG
jgi:LPS sulfotransferase NodH